MRALILVLGILAIMPSAALGAQVARENPIAVAEHIAAGYWGTTPCGGAITITHAPETPELEAGWLALYGHASHAESWSSWVSPDGANSKAAPASTFTNCTITFNSTRWPSEAVEDTWFVELCSDMVHEYGNLLGLPELRSGAPSVMGMGTNAVDPPRCETFY